MDVKELIKRLEQLPQDAPVVLQEGMGYWRVTEAIKIEDFGQTKVLIQ